VYLPAQEREASEVGTKLEPPVRGGTERILLAEDQEAVRMMVTHLLLDAGYQVDAVADGLEAVQAAERADYDLVLLDAIMPRMNGRQAYEKIKQLRPLTRFLFSSGYSADTLPELFVAGGREDILQKPYEADTLLRAVRRVLDAAAAV
jgi:two-component system cell cycle sensor histidine kinase/response regulator CckA